MPAPAQCYMLLCTLLYRAWPSDPPKKFASPNIARQSHHHLTLLFLGISPLPPWMIYLRFPSAPLLHKIAIRPVIFCSKNFIFRTMATLPSFHPRGYSVSICCPIDSMALIRQLYTVSQSLTDLAHPGSSRGPQHATDELQRPRGDPQVW